MYYYKNEDGYFASLEKYEAEGYTELTEEQYKREIEEIDKQKHQKKNQNGSASNQ